MDKKQAKILYTINQNNNLTKLDIKNKTGFSMTTVLNCVKKLQEQELITCGVRKAKGGKAPSVINSSVSAYVLGVGYAKGYLRAIRFDLNGNLEKITEKRTEETKENIDFALNELSKDYPPVAIGIITENLSYSYIENKLSKHTRESAKLTEGLACFYRFFSVKSNVDMAILYIDNQITLMKSGENISYCDVKSLFSPIIHAKQGRLTYEQVLSKNAVEERLSNKFNANINDLETSSDVRILEYKNRLNLTLEELVNMTDKMLLPKIIIVGGYLPESSIKPISKNLHSKVFFAGDASCAVAHCAGAMALESLYYYD